VDAPRYSYNCGVPELVSPISDRPIYAFPIALIVSLFYFATLVALNLHKADEIGQLIDLARLLPSTEPYTIDFWAYTLGLPAMTLVALLLILACALGLCRRSARGVLIAYVMLQITLIIIHWGRRHQPRSLRPIHLHPRRRHLHLRRLQRHPPHAARGPPYLLIAAACQPMLFPPAVRRAFSRRNTAAVCSDTTHPKCCKRSAA